MCTVKLFLLHILYHFSQSEVSFIFLITPRQSISSFAVKPERQLECHEIKYHLVTGGGSVWNLLDPHIPHPQTPSAPIPPPPGSGPSSPTPLIKWAFLSQPPLPW